MKQAAKLAQLQQLAELKHARALAEYAQINSEALAVRGQISAAQGELSRARQAPAPDPIASAIALERFAEWTTARQSGLNTRLAGIEAERLGARERAQLSQGRNDILSQLIADEHEAEQKKAGNRHLDAIIFDSLTRTPRKRPPQTHGNPFKSKR